MKVERLMTIWVKTSFVGFHRWKDAPADFDYLHHWHRHEFQVKVHAKVNHVNRDIEFHAFKREIDSYLVKWRDQYFEASCELIATDILNEFADAILVEVSEDGECGAVVMERGV